MKQIVKSLSRLKGVHHATIYKDGELLASSFDRSKSDAMLDSAEIMAQIFSALEAIEQSHDEIFFSIGENYLVAYLLSDSHIALLLTDKKINFPLIGMGVKSASGKISRKAKEEEKRKTEEASHETKIQATSDIPTDEAYHDKFEQLSVALIEYLGPAAKFVVEDSVSLWKKKYIQNTENLPHLVEFIVAELSTDSEKEQFSKQANKIIEQE